MKYIFYILLINLAACGMPYTPGEPLTEKQLDTVAMVQPKLEKYFNLDLSKVFKDTSITLKPAEEISADCHIPGPLGGCYFDKHIEIAKENIVFCSFLVHEYLHAIGDQMFGDMDKNHVRYPFYTLPQVICD